MEETEKKKLEELKKREEEMKKREAEGKSKSGEKRSETDSENPISLSTSFSMSSLGIVFFFFEKMLNDQFY